MKTNVVWLGAVLVVCLSASQALACGQDGGQGNENGQNNNGVGGQKKAAPGNTAEQPARVTPPGGTGTSTPPAPVPKGPATPGTGSTQTRVTPGEAERRAVQANGQCGQ
jgi:hypothetical protein